MHDRTIVVRQGVCLGQECDNDRIVSEGAGTVEKQGIYFAWPYAETQPSPPHTHTHF